MNEANCSYFRDLSTFFFRLRSSKPNLHRLRVLLQICSELSVVVIVIDFKVLTDVLALLDQERNLLKFLKGLPRVVQYEEVKHFLQMLCQVPRTALIFVLGQEIVQIVITVDIRYLFVFNFALSHLILTLII